MKRWVVTGPTGAGKSALTRLLAERGAVVLDGDLLGHEILRAEPVINEIEQIFGADCLSGGEVDRAVLGRKVFDDQEALRQLNRITHGPLSALMTRRMAELETAGTTGLAVLEAAVYFLLPSPPPADLVITVTASPRTRLQRLIQAGLTPGAAEARIDRQKDLESDFATADLIIVNSGTLADLQSEADRLLAGHLTPPA